MDNLVMLYAVYDDQAQRFGPLYESVNDAVAVRKFYMMLKDVPEEFRKEYRLFKIGEYDMLKGIIEPQQNPIIVLDGGLVEVKK